MELEYSLEPGSYIILPRTSGCLLRRHVDLPNHKIQLLDKNGKLSDLMSSTVDDIFRKFDMLLNRELTFTEFKSFMECLNKNVTESEFKQRMLKKYCSTA